MKTTFIYKIPHQNIALSNLRYILNHQHGVKGYRCPHTHPSAGALLAPPRPQLFPDAQPDSFSVERLLHLFHLQQGQVMSF